MPERRLRWGDLLAVTMVQIAKYEVREDNIRALRQGWIQLHNPHTDHIRDRVLRDSHHHRDIDILVKCMPLLHPVRLVVDHMQASVVF